MKIIVRAAIKIKKFKNIASVGGTVQQFSKWLFQSDCTCKPKLLLKGNNINKRTSIDIAQNICWNLILRFAVQINFHKIAKYKFSTNTSSYRVLTSSV